MEKRLFNNLYIQTEYNFLSSTVSIKNLKNEMHKFEGTALAIMDNSMHGAYKFYKACKENGNVKPIIGLRCKVNNDYIDNYCLLYAKNNIGYKKLMCISSEIQTSKTKSVSKEFLKENNNGIIAIIPFYENEVHYYYDNGYSQKFDETLIEYKALFEETYLGLTLQVSNYNIKSIMQRAKSLGLDSVAIHKVNMMKEDHLEAYKILKCIDKNVKNIEVNELEVNSYFENNEELLNQYSEYEELIINQERIVNNCNVEIKFNGYLFPKVDLEKTTSKDYLASLCKAGLNKRIEQNRVIYNKNYAGKIETYRDRLLMELEVIDKMGFNDYFLVVYDYVKFAKNNEIYVGPGRGSGGGSLVCYSLGITDIDPIEYGLLFERFLNIERISMPDIDCDFEDDRRNEVINHLGERYGLNRVAHISTYGTYKPRMSIKDVAKVLGTSENKLNEIMKYVPKSDDKQNEIMQYVIKNDKELSLTEIIENSPILKRMIETDEEVNRIIKNALIIENLPKNVSTHAAGIIMAPNDLRDYTPLSNGLDGLMQTQYEASDLEEIGLVKMDILGLRTLTIIKNIVNLIKRQNPNFDYNKIPFDDKATYEMLRRGETTGVFQLEAAGVRKTLGSIRTSQFEDIVSATSLFRPGPMDNIPTFAARKLGREKINYLDPSIEKVLNTTYGVIVYQEQIMLIASIFAGYSLGEADVLRRAISKKKASIMEKQKSIFIQKAVNNGKDSKIAAKMFDYIEKFASYGFNRSHAVAYSVMAYKMAYLKNYYNEEYMCSVLNNVIGDSDKTIDYISECKKNGIKVYAPSINKSEIGYICAKKSILYPLLGIKGIGEIIVNKIINERDVEPFKSFDNFITRMKGVIDKKTACSLIYAGCFDEFKETRKSMVENYDAIVSRSGYGDGNTLFRVIERKKNDDEFGFEEISLLEKEALGFNLKYDLFIKYFPLKQKYQTIDLDKLKEGIESKVFFVIRNVRVIKTKKGEDMAFLTACDSNKNYDAIIFPKAYASINGLLENNKPALAKAKLETKENEGIIKTNLIIEELYIVKE